jgi:hypothetical protein
MSYAIFGLIALFLLSAGYNYLQHKNNVKALEQFVGTTKALKAAESENEEMTKALAMFVSDGQTEVRVGVDESTIDERLKAFNSRVLAFEERLEVLNEQVAETFGNLERVIGTTESYGKELRQELGKFKNDAHEKMNELRAQNEEYASKLKAMDVENKELGLALAQVVDEEGKVLHQIRLPGHEARPNVTPCGPLCSHAFWRVDEKYRNKEAELRRRYGAWHCRAGANMKASNVRDEFLDGENQCAMFTPSVELPESEDGIDKEHLTRGAIAEYSSVQQEMEATKRALRDSMLRQVMLMKRSGKG